MKDHGISIKTAKGVTTLTIPFKKIWISCDSDGTIDIWRIEPNWTLMPYNEPVWDTAASYLNKEILTEGYKGRINKNLIDFLDHQIGLPKPGELWVVTWGKGVCLV